MFHSVIEVISISVHFWTLKTYYPHHWILQHMKMTCCIASRRVALYNHNHDVYLLSSAWFTFYPLICVQKFKTILKNDEQTLIYLCVKKFRAPLLLTGESWEKVEFRKFPSFLPISTSLSNKLWEKVWTCQLGICSPLLYIGKL